VQARTCVMAAPLKQRQRISEWREFETRASDHSL
jgi:hypothetical protein